MYFSSRLVSLVRCGQFTSADGCIDAKRLWVKKHTELRSENKCKTRKEFSGFALRKVKSLYGNSKELFALLSSEWKSTTIEKQLKSWGNVLEFRDIILLVLTSLNGVGFMKKEDPLVKQLSALTLRDFRTRPRKNLQKVIRGCLKL